MMISIKKQIIQQSYSLYEREVTAYIVRVFPKFSRQDADDVYHDTWVWILEKATNIPDLRDKSNKPWLVQKIRWHCLNKIRGTKTYWNCLESWVNRKGTINASEQNNQFEIIHDLEAAYELFNLLRNKWGAKCRNLFEQYYIQGFSTKEIAQMFEKNQQTIKNNLALCRKNIKHLLEELWKN